MLCAAFLAFLGPGERRGGDDVQLMPEEAQKDLKILKELLVRTHPDPYRFVSQADLEVHFRSISDSIALPVSAERFRDLIVPLFHALGDANCHPLPRPIPRTVPLLPFQVTVLDAGVFIGDEQKGFRSFPRGSRILSINGHPIDAILERMAEQVFTDGTNETLRKSLLSADFAGLYYRLMDDGKAFTVVCTSPGGELLEELVMGMSQEDVERSKRPIGVDVAPWTSTEHPDSRALWLSLSTLDEQVLEEAGMKPSKYLGSIRQEMERAKLTVLVIDVRSAAGRELGIAETVFGMIAKAPYRVVQDVTIRSKEPPALYEAAVTVDDFYASIATGFQGPTGGPLHLPMDDERLQLLEPSPKAFQGKVYVVCDGGTRDAAAALVMMAKRSNRAKVVGEEVGTNALRFNGGRELLVTLPNSGIRLRIPLMSYSPEGKPTGPVDQGELPHYTVVPLQDIMARSGDTVKEALLEMIREQQ
jgi:hypothetical protein